MLRKVSVLRLGHRYPRDARVSTHLALVSWAFGIDELIYTGDRDVEFESNVGRIISKWGSKFVIRYEDNYRDIIKQYKSKDYRIIHLTMYGVNVNYLMDELLNISKHLVVVGGQKVPGEIFRLSDFNVAIGGLPHSEISALAVYLDRIYMGIQLERHPSVSRSIVQMKLGKKIVEDNDLNYSSH